MLLEEKPKHSQNSALSLSARDRRVHRVRAAEGSADSQPEPDNQAQRAKLIDNLDALFRVVFLFRQDIEVPASLGLEGLLECLRSCGLQDDVERIRIRAFPSTRRSS